MRSEESNEHIVMLIYSMSSNVFFFSLYQNYFFHYHVNKGHVA